MTWAPASNVPAQLPSCGAVCSLSFEHDTLVKLTATPDSESTFTGWSGACTGTGACSVTLTEAASVTATFERPPVSLTVTRNGSGDGLVSSTPVLEPCESQATA